VKEKRSSQEFEDIIQPPQQVRALKKKKKEEKEEEREEEKRNLPLPKPNVEAPPPVVYDEAKDDLFVDGHLADAGPANDLDQLIIDDAYDR